MEFPALTTACMSNAHLPNVFPHLEDKGENFQEEAKSRGDYTADFTTGDVHRDFLAVKRLVHLHLQLVQLGNKT